MRRKLVHWWFWLRHPIFYWRELRKQPSRLKEGSEAYQAAMKPFVDVLASVQLPPRGEVGSEDNYRRAWLISKALHDKKLELAKEKEGNDVSSMDKR